ncbi:uncharacterized protein LOC129226913 [Uloborus diversus]|uniref:uncharacterized protein LOC129226913 n=1 Tax=Uloborus diversus TaxID=327109 RepID=UPI002409A57C|nr:uncharacterized protein LOC129226913 [Uloborus diversus]
MIHEDRTRAMMTNLAPLLWSLALWWSVVGAVNSLPGTQDCEEARMKCAYRANCARALHSYMVDCADVLAGRTKRCPWSCKRALISLASSEAGIALAECECGENEFCRRSKERAEVCRPEVSIAIAEGTVVPCAVAEWICAADHLCSTALEYYYRLCRPMFQGRKCTFRCNNSLAILDRQPKAGKLRNCYCDGSEDFPCHAVKKNTQQLCYGRDEWTDDSNNFINSKTDVESSSERASSCGLLCIFLCFFGLWTTDSFLFTSNRIFVSSGKKNGLGFLNTKIKNIASFLCKRKWIDLLRHCFQDTLNIHKHFYWTRAKFGCTFRTRITTFYEKKFLNCSSHSLAWYSKLKRPSLTSWPWWWTSERF